MLSTSSIVVGSRPFPLIEAPHVCRDGGTNIDKLDNIGG